LASGKYKRRGSFNGVCFKWVGTEGNVQPHAFGILEEQNAVANSKLRGVRSSGDEYLEQRLDECAFRAETGHQSKVRIVGEPWLAPSLHRNSANETKSPTLFLANCLQLKGGGEDIVHFRFHL
jgi:hypothetical protein